MNYLLTRKTTIYRLKRTLVVASAGILPIVLGVAGALLLLLIVLAVVCILKK